MARVLPRAHLRRHGLTPLESELQQLQKRRHPNNSQCIRKLRNPVILLHFYFYSWRVWGCYRVWSRHHSIASSLATPGNALDAKRGKTAIRWARPERRQRQAQKGLRHPCALACPPPVTHDAERSAVCVRFPEVRAVVHFDTAGAPGASLSRFTWIPPQKEKVHPDCPRIRWSCKNHRFV